MGTTERGRVLLNPYMKHQANICLIGCVFPLAVICSAAPQPQFPAFTGSFEATYLWRHSESGMPVKPNIYADTVPFFSAKTRARLGIPESYHPQAGDCLFTIASNGKSQLYMWSHGDKPSDIYLLMDGHTFITNMRSAEFDSGFKSCFAPHQVPILPATLPGAQPFVQKYSPKTGAELDELSPEDIRVNIVQFLGGYGDNGVYQPGYMLKDPETGALIKLWCGPKDHPNYLMTFSGTETIQGISVPTGAVIKTDDFAELKSGEPAVNWKRQDTFQLLGAGPLKLSKSTFSPRTYLHRNQLVSNGVIAIAIDPSKPLEPQFAAYDKRHASTQNQGNSAVMVFGAAMACTMCAAVWKGRR